MKIVIGIILLSLLVLTAMSATALTSPEITPTVITTGVHPMTVTPRTRTPTPPTPPTSIPPTSIPPTATPPAFALRPIAKGAVAFPMQPDNMCGDLAKIGVAWYQTGWQLRACPLIEEVAAVEWTWGPQMVDMAQILLVWNELDISGIPPCTAATRWHDEIEPAYPNKLLGSPGQGFWYRNWLPRFWDCYKSQYGHDPHMDYVTVHCYSVPGRNCLTEFSAAAAWGMARGKLTMITEYAALSKGNPYHCLPKGCPDCQTQAQALIEAKRVLDGIKLIPGIVAVSWYNTRTPGDDGGAMDCNSPLVNADGTLTAFGRFYRDWR